MRFPLKFIKSEFPSKNRCAWCKKQGVGEPNSCAILSGGSLLMNRRTGDGGPDKRLDGFLDLTWHGAHTNEGGRGVYPDIFKSIEIAKDIEGGQFHISFCSTKCLRAFLNHAVDTLETKMKGKKKRKKS